MPSDHLEAELRKYGMVLLVSTLLFIGFSEFISFRRGYYDLYIINKVLAGVAAIDFGIIILLGPLSRLFSFADGYLELRKEFGVVGMALAVTHSIVSFFFLPNKFSPEFFFTKQFGPFIFGLVAAVIAILLFVISREKIAASLGRARWWKMQYWGMRVVFILTLLHVFVMKWKGWIDWYMNGGSKDLVHPEWPGGGLIVGWFIAFALLMRVAELFGARVGRIMWYITIVALPLIYILTFVRGATL